MRLKAIIIFVLVACRSLAQTGYSVFNDNVVHDIYITISPEHWFDTLTLDYQNHRKNPNNVPEISRKCYLTFDQIFSDTIGIRQKGNSSNVFNSVKWKKPFKLEIDAFNNLKLDGLKNLNLNNATDDPSFVREALCYRLVRDAGLPAPRTAYAKVYINKQYWGLYMLVESVDKTFLKDHYGGKGKDGNLYKTAQSGQAYLKPVDTTDTLYKQKTGLELKTNNTGDNWTRLINFIYLINHAEMLGFKDSLLKYFDVASYLKLLAIEKLVFSWDNYCNNGNNYYLYEHPDGSIRWISWDMNETFPNEHGFDPSILGGANYLLPTNHYDNRPLLKAIFSVPEWENQYYDIVCGLLNKEYTVKNIDTIIFRWHQLIEEAVYNDTNKFYSFEAFDASLTGEKIVADFTFPRTGFRLKRKLPAIIPFVHEQRAWAGEQIDFLGYSCSFAKPLDFKYNLKVYPNPSNYNTINLSWDMDIADGLSRIQLYNSSGKLVTDLYNQKSEQKQLQTTVNDLPSGIYWIRKLDAEGSMGVCKWVKL